jgi:hypothetical protein
MWVKLDDEVDDAPKILAVSPLAALLWIWGTVWSARKLTDGFIPRRKALTLLATEDYRWPDGRPILVGELIAELTAGGEHALWHEEEGGFRIHDFLEYQLSKEAVLALREASRLQRVNAGRSRAARATRGEDGTFLAAGAEPPAGPGEEGEPEEVLPLPAGAACLCGGLGEPPEGWEPITVKVSAQRAPLPAGPAEPSGQPASEPASQPAPLPASRFPVPGLDPGLPGMEGGATADPGQRPAPRRAPRTVDNSLALVEFPTDGPVKTWAFRDGFRARLAEAFPALEILAEVGRAKLWIETHPAERKTAGGMEAFLLDWCRRSQNRPSLRAGTRAGASRSTGEPPSLQSIAQEVSEGLKT